MENSSVSSRRQLHSREQKEALLVYEQGGFTIFYRRLEKGTFEVPAFDLDAQSLELTIDQLHFVLRGISL